MLLAVLSILPGKNGSTCLTFRIPEYTPHPTTDLGETMSNSETHNWPDLAVGLYERLTGQNAEIIYDFENMTVEIPSGTGPDVRHAPWRLNGTVRISTRNNNDS
jgi:hypothetical protein